MRRSHLLANTLILAAIGLTVSLPDARSRDWEAPDPVVHRIRSMIDRQQYRAVADTIGPLIEAARTDGDSLTLGQLICARGQAELGTGEVSKSLESLDLAREMSRTRADTVTWMTALGVSAFALNQQGRFEESVKRSRIQVRLAQASRDGQSQAFAQLSTGFAELRRGRLETARSAYEQAIELFADADLSNWQVTALTGLGRVETEAGRFEAGSRIYDRVITLARSIGDRRNEIDATNNLGVIEFRHGDFDLGVQYFQRAYEMQLERGDLILAASIMTNVSRCRALIGDTSGAIEILDEIRIVADKAGATEAYLHATGQKGVICNIQGRFNEAIRIQREVLKRATASDLRLRSSVNLVTSLTKVDSLEAALEVLRGVEEESRYGSPQDRARLALWNGVVLRRLGRVEEAMSAMEPLEPLVEGDPVETEFKAVYSRCLSESGRIDAAWERILAVVHSVERRRSRTESGLIREAMGQGSHRILVDAVGSVQENRTPDTTHPELFEVFDLLQQMKARTLVERLASPGRATDLSIHAVDLRQVQDDILTDADVLLDYYVGDEYALAFAVNPSTVRFAILDAEPSELEESMELFVEMISGEAVAKDGEMSLSVPAHRLRAILLEPFADMIGGADRLMFSPDGSAASIPFGLLPEGSESDSPLLLTKEIVYVPSVSMVPFLNEEPSGTGLMTLVGTDDVLEGADDEVRSLQRRFAGVRSIEGLPAGLADSLATAAILHVAAHTEINRGRAWYSGIRLRSASTTDSTTALLQSTHLRAMDLLDHRMRAGIAVLASCESGLGELTHGEGVIGLSSALLVAQVPSVVSTLWPVDDAATRDLMLAFYDRLAGGVSVAQALREAQLELRGRPRTKHPYYWAGFVLTGSPDTRVSLQRQGVTPLRMAVALSLGALIMGSLLWWRVSRRRTSTAA